MVNYSIQQGACDDSDFSEMKVWVISSEMKDPNKLRSWLRAKETRLILEGGSHECQSWSPASDRHVACLFSFSSLLGVCVCVCIQTIRVYVHTCTHTYTYMHMGVRAHTRAHVHTHTHTHTEDLLFSFTSSISQRCPGNSSPLSSCSLF